MNITNYHSKLYAYELTKRCASDSLEKLAGAVASAQVDLNPHQVNAALFAFNSPLSKGALLADEVGLGKTIEAGLILSQKWAERKRNILIICPSNLRKQWYQELTEKFFLPCHILESKSYNADIKQGNLQPFNVSNIVICSYQFAKSKADDIKTIPWDLVVIDEAHRLRNVYKTSNVIATTLKTALIGKHKLLLTATPLQNSLLELFGLISFIDDHIFGDLQSFREQFTNLNQEQTFTTLKSRIKHVCNRTLRRQVTAYIPYTKRLPLVEEFTPDDSEEQLYSLVSNYLQRDNLYALPSGQRALMTLVLRKLLASSTFAIAGALSTMSNRLKGIIQLDESKYSLEDDLDNDYDSYIDTSEEWVSDQDQVKLSKNDHIAILEEIREIETFVKLATSINQNAKGQALLKALNIAFEKTKKLGASQKAIIFTESRRTQDYLLRLLEDSQFKKEIVLFNGTNTDEQSKNIYNQWVIKHKGTDRVTGSRMADMRSAIVDYFKESASIMIATEAGAEGINLQFCSLVINYDLPWNPQRIEQRIGRCHRYGQKHDVVVVNFLNRKNAADKRVFELLAEKFHLFEGVFGASDEVLGSLESGVDFEKRIAEIYQRCRKEDEIQLAFDQLQTELSLEINESITHTRQKLLENFDDEVRDKLKNQDQASKDYLNRYERLLIRLTQHELKNHAEFVTDASFNLRTNPFNSVFPEIPLGLYELPRRTGEAHFYRLNHPLAIKILNTAKERDLPPVEIQLSYGQYEGKISVLESLIGSSGWLAVTLYSIESLEQSEDHLIFSAITDNGIVLETDIASRLLILPGKIIAPIKMTSIPKALSDLTEGKKSLIKSQISERNAKFYEDEANKLDGWADDLKVALEREIKEFDKQIRDARRSATLASTLEDKLIAQKQIKSIEKIRNQKRKSLFDAQDEVDKQRDELIKMIEDKLSQKSSSVNLFHIKWQLI